MNTIEEIKQRLDILEIANQYTRLTKSGKNFKGICPFHQEKHGSFFVFPDRQSWHCFGACSAGGDIFALVMKKESLTFVEALKLLASRAGVDVPDFRKNIEEKAKYSNIYAANEAARSYFHNTLLTHPSANNTRDYVKYRGLNTVSLKDFQIGCSLNEPDNLKKFLLKQGYGIKELIEAGLVIETASGVIDRFRNRVIFPINDIRGRTVGFGGRSLGNTQPKYLNSPETPVFNKSQLMYGLDLARDAIKENNEVIIVEGYIDAIIARQHGFSNTIAVMGTAVNREQIESLKNITTNIILAMDSDEAGNKGMLRMIEYENVLNNEIKVAAIPEGLDPDQVIRKSLDQWQTLIHNARPLVDFTIDRYKSEVDLSTAKGKAVFAENILPIIAQMRDVIRQAHYLGTLSKLLGIEPSKLEASLNKIKFGKSAPGHRLPEKNKNQITNVFANPREEYCLGILLQNPRLKYSLEGLQPEHFNNTENAEVFKLILDSKNLQIESNLVSNTMSEYLEHLKNLKIGDTEIEQKLKECILLIKENHYRQLLRNQEAVFELPDLTKEEKERLIKESALISQQLHEIFTIRSKKHLGRNKGVNL